MEDLEHAEDDYLQTAVVCVWCMHSFKLTSDPKCKGLIYVGGAQLVFDLLRETRRSLGLGNDEQGAGQRLRRQQGRWVSEEEEEEEEEKEEEEGRL